MKDIYASEVGLLTALHTIQDECKAHRDCGTCPLRNDDNDDNPNLCGVRDEIPGCWELNDIMTWRAFK